MYGKASELWMNPLIIIIDSNYVLNQGFLSTERWSIYEIKNNELVKKNELIKKQKNKERVKKIKKYQKEYLIFQKLF